MHLSETLTPIETKETQSLEYQSCYPPQNLTNKRSRWNNPKLSNLEGNENFPKDGKTCHQNWRNKASTHMWPSPQALARMSKTTIEATLLWINGIIIF